MIAADRDELSSIDLFSNISRNTDGYGTLDPISGPGSPEY